MEQSDKPRPIIPTENGAYPPNLKYPPKEPKRDYEILIPFAFLIFITLFSYDIYEQNYMKNRAKTIDCKLLNRDFKSLSGFRTKYIVNFDCGNYGILISDDKEIFRQAKENNKLSVYFGKNDYQIFKIN